nr:MAG TPA: virion protein [Siphoviridae sp. ctFjF5]DAU57358.1 MAG TPA: virion protein [Caudoviricetes sp.]
MSRREFFGTLFISCAMASLTIFSTSMYLKLRNYEIYADTYIRSLVKENSYFKDKMSDAMMESAQLKAQLKDCQDKGTISQDKKEVYGDTRGLRNNNPCNLKSSKNTKWDGQIGSDGKFIIFESPEYGIRACAKNLKNYQQKNGLDTLRSIVYRMGPPHENDTKKYVRNLSNIVGVSPDEKINVLKHLPEIIKGIIFLENGKMPYPEKMFIGYTIFN